MRRILALVFAAACGVGAVMLLQKTLAEQRRALAQERQKLLADYQRPVEVIVAAKDLPESTTLDAGALKTALVPEKFVQPYAARSSSDVLGLVTIAPMAEGEQMLVNKVRRPEAAAPARDATLSALTPEGKRAITIAVDAITGVGGFVRPGDAVDILWTIQLPQEGQQRESQVVTLTLFQNVQVLAVGADMGGRGRTKAAASPEESRTVTLALTPQETSFLLFAREQGRIQLSLRSHADTSEVAVTPANINSLMEKVLSQQGPMPGTAPRPAAKNTRQVEVYKGLKRDVVLLPDE